MYTDMSIQESRIADILNQRKPFYDEIQSKQKNLCQQILALKELKAQYLKIQQQELQGMFGLIEHLPLTQLVDKMEGVNKELSKPMYRFARQTLNIGVIGRAGQGKSTLLQQLSSVGPEAIPTGDRGFCTGVRSVIQHNSDPLQKGGKISFYTQEEFLHNVLTPYYQRLNLGNEPQTLESFTSDPLPKPRKNDALSQAMYKHLLKYQKYAPLYKEWLGANDWQVPIDEIRQFVAQESLDGSQKYYTFMAVKRAVITTNFNRKDVERIALVDMPGLGETSVGDDERLMQALGEEVDVVLFVLMPHMRAELQDYDFQLYNLAHDSMGEFIPIKDWSFMVLNHRKTSDDDNQTRCEDIKSKIESGNPGHGDHPIKVVKCIVADCKNEAAEVLAPVVEYLSSKMRMLDEEYMAAWRQKLCILDQEIKQLLEQASLALDEKASEHKEGQEFEQHFHKLWSHLKTESLSLVKDLRDESTNPDATFASHLQKIIATCRDEDQGLPTLDEITNRIGLHGAPINAFNDFLHDIRTHLTRHFMGIDTHTNFTMDEVKTRVSHLFLSSGRLSNLFPRLAHQEKDLFATMATQPLLSESLRQTFRMLGNYQLTLRGIFLSFIREGDTLADISPFHETRIPPDELSPEGILQKLDSLQKATVEKIEQQTSGIATIPSSAACALGEEFIDQTLRSKDVASSWRLFYQAHRTTIWPEVFEQSTRWNDLQQAWQKAHQAAWSTHLNSPICILG